MSDLENASVRAGSVPTGRPITAFATGKLASIGGKASLFSQSDGLVDAFAEVFASFAASDAGVGSQSLVADSEIGQEVRTDESDELRESDVKQTDESDVPQDVQTTDLIVPVSQQETVVHDVAIETEVELSNHDQANVQEETPEVGIAAIQQAEFESSDQNNETPEFSQQQVSQTETEQEGSDRRRYSETIQTGEETEGIRPRPDAIKQSKDRPDEIGEVENEELLGSETEGTAEVEVPSDSRRRRGRHRHDANTKNQGVDALGKAGQRSPSQIHSPQANSPTNSSPNSSQIDTIADTIRPVESSQQAKPLGNHINPVVTQALSRSAVRADSTGGLQAGRGGASGQPPQGIEGMRDNARARPEDAASQPASKSKQSSAAETVSRVKLIQRVSKAFQHLGNEGGVIRLRLAPGELGSVRVEMKVQNRNVQARVVAETEAASSSLREHLPDLRARLESLGMQVEKIEVETESDNLEQHSFFAETGQQHPSDDRQQFQRRSPETPAKTPVENVPSQVSRLSTDLTQYAHPGVDIRL